eukprot:581425-Pyramimonas_sp.AAC.1
MAQSRAFTTKQVHVRSIFIWGYHSSDSGSVGHGQAESTSLMSTVTLCKRSKKASPAWTMKLPS